MIFFICIFLESRGYITKEYIQGSKGKGGDPSSGYNEKLSTYLSKDAKFPEKLQLVPLR